MITKHDDGIHVAIIGGGIAGVTLALGLLSRGVSTTVYERGSSFREIGAGIGFTPNSERAMKALDPRIHAAFKRVTVQNGTDWFMWMDGGSTPKGNDVDGDVGLIHKMYLGERGFEGCARADFLDELVKLIPAETIQFQKKVEEIVDVEGSERVQLKFSDGSSEDADVVIGCDGIRSKVRQLIVGKENPASYPSYSHKYAFRGLIPMSAAEPVLGIEKTETRHMYLGPNSHALTFPVAGGKLLNVVAFTTDNDDWPHPDKFTAPASKADAIKAFADFHPTVRAIIDLLPEQLDKWAVFDTYDHPIPFFTKGRICISGDAAHAAAPYHGAGAGLAIEDGAVLAHLLAAVNDQARTENASVPELSRAALEAYNTTRIKRARWLVETSRFVGKMYEWQDAEIGGDRQKCADEIEWRSKEIWDYDIEKMLEQASENFERSRKIATHVPHAM